MKKGWKTRRLGEVCDLYQGLAINTKTKHLLVSHSNLPLLRIKDLKNNTVEQYVAESGFPPGALTKKEDIIYTRTGSLGLVFRGREGVLHNNSFRVIPKSIIDKNYLFLWLNAPSFKKNILSLALKAAQPDISHKIFKEQIIPIPSISEQQEIVLMLEELFEELDKIIEKLQKNLNNARGLFESYLNNIFDHSKKEWESKKLGEACELINRGVSPKYTKSSGLLVINQRCIRDHKVNYDFARLHDTSLKSVSLDKYIKFGDVLVNSTGTGTLGRVAQVRENGIKATVDSHVTIVRPKSNIFYTEYFGYALIYLEKEISKRGEGCGGQTELSRDILKNHFKINYPTSQAEQKYIVANLDKLSSQTKKLESLYQKKLSLLEELKKSILEKAFSGELTKDFNSEELQDRINA